MTKSELRELAASDGDGALKAALSAVTDGDRNVRVLALRIVGADGRPEGAPAIIAGLNDGKRRVRDVALKSSRHYLGDPAVVARIAAMVEDEGETGKLRSRALLALGGGYPRPNQAGEIPAAALKALEALATRDRMRGAILRSLAAMDMTEDVRALLREFVRTGTKEEAVAATRALCGYRLVNSGNATSEELAAAGAEPADGVYRWVPRRNPQ
jgi:hypothetical protein